MIKKNLKTIIATALITLSPIVMGLIMWDKLPEKIVTTFTTKKNKSIFGDATIFLIFSNALSSLY